MALLGLMGGGGLGGGWGAVVDEGLLTIECNGIILGIIVIVIVIVLAHI